MSVLNTIQTDCKTQLEANSFFSASPVIPVLIELRLDILSEIERRLARLGLAVVIATPRLSTSSHTGKLLWDRLEVDVSVLENVVINRSASGIGQPAPLVAEAAAFALHGFEPSSSGYKLYCSAVTPESDAQILIYNVRFFTGAIAAQPSRLT